MQPPTFNHVYQFKITLEDIKPIIWRCILVPETYTFWDLHVAIQDAMGWEDCHLHEFEIIHPITNVQTRIGIPDGEWGIAGILPEWEVKMSDYFKGKIKTAYYEYDFGDGWRHKLQLEKVLFRDLNTKYPLCLEGQRSCPPEDCGGAWGYAHLLEVISNPHHPEYVDLTNWIGKRFDPEKFQPDKVRFSNPKRRFSMSMIPVVSSQ